MRSLVLGIGLTPLFLCLGSGPLGLLSQNQAQASFCGVARCCHAHCVPCCQQCCTVMKTCQVTVYTYQEMTAYKIVYEDVVDKVTVPAVEYQPSPRDVCVPDTVLVPPKPGACPPASPPANACAPCAAPCLVPMNICRKVTLPGVRPVCVQKPDVCKRVVAKQVPYQVTLCIPHTELRQVPVQVCCPVPCCCCTTPSAWGTGAKAGCEGCGK